jgi:hypothetical protein
MGRLALAGGALVFYFQFRHAITRLSAKEQNN